MLRNTCAAPEELFDDDAVGATAAPAPLPPPRALPLPRAPPLPKKPAASKKLPVGRQSWPEARKPRANPGQLPPGRKMEGRDGKTWVVVETFEAGRHAWELVGKESPREAADALLMAERRYAAEREERAEQTARAAARKAQGRAQHEADAAAREAEAAARARAAAEAQREAEAAARYGAAPKANPSQLPVGRKMEGRDGRVWVVVETASVGRHAWECPEDAEERALARAEKKAARAEAKAAKSAKAAAAAAAAALVADSSQEPSRRGSLADSSDAEAAAEAAAMAYDSSEAEETAEAVKSPEKSYEVERIVAYRQKDATGDAEYLVKWKGCTIGRASDAGRLPHAQPHTTHPAPLPSTLYRYGKHHNTWEPIEHLTTPAAKREAAQVKAAATRSARAEQLKRESGGGEVTDLTTKGGSKVGFEVTVPLLCMHKMEHEGGYPLCELPFGHAGPHSTGASLGKRQRAEKKRFDDEAYGPKGGRAKLPGPPPASAKAAKLASVVPERYNARGAGGGGGGGAAAAAEAAAAHPMGYVPKPKPPAAEAKGAKAKPAAAAAAAENGGDGGEEPAVTPEVTEVDGLQLHLSGANPTGYLGLQVVDGARFRARYGQKHIGTYGTAVEAAVAYAKAVAAAENGGDGGEEGEGERPSSSATGEEEEGGEGAAEERPERAEGFDLETSSRNSTGYRGVFLSHGKFEARHKSKYIGHFETAVQGGGGVREGEGGGGGGGRVARERVGVAAAAGGDAPRRRRRQRGDPHQVGARRRRRRGAVAHGARRRRRRGLGRGGGRGRAEAVRGGEPGAGGGGGGGGGRGRGRGGAAGDGDAADGFVIEADGVSLKLSEKNSSGYLGVKVEHSKGDGPDRYRGALRIKGSDHHIGTYATAVGAALAVTRYLAALPAADSEAPAEAASVPPTPSGAAPTGPTEERRRTRVSEPGSSAGSPPSQKRAAAEAAADDGSPSKKKKKLSFDGGGGASSSKLRPSPPSCSAAKFEHEGGRFNCRQPFGHAGRTTRPSRCRRAVPTGSASRASARRRAGAREPRAAGFGWGRVGKGRGSDPSAAE